MTLELWLTNLVNYSAQIAVIITAGSLAPLALRLRSPDAMLVTPIDVGMTVLPALWAPQHVKALVAMAVTSQLMLTNGRRYRTRLHVSVLDELPGLMVAVWLPRPE